MYDVVIWVKSYTRGERSYERKKKKNINCETDDFILNVEESRTFRFTQTLFSFS